MKFRTVTYLSIISLLLVLGSQAYIVYDHFRLTQESLLRETNAILDEAYNIDLNARNKSISTTDHDSIVTLQSTNKSVVEDTNRAVATYNMDNMNMDKSDILKLIATGLNNYTSKKAPLNIHKLDSVTQIVLKNRDIQSDFTIRVVNPQTGKVLESSKDTIINSKFLICSQYLVLDFEKQKSLQLVLLNPLANIFKRMGMLLFGSFLLLLFCLYGLWFLFRTLSREKKLMVVKNDFFGHTAHELKRPVSHLHMALEALSNPAIDGNKVKKERYLAISKEATKDIMEKITMILTLSMAEEGVFKLNFSEFDLKELIEVLKDKFTAVAEKSVTIDFQCTEDEIIVKADRDHLRQTMANLIDNAIKYSNDSVEISISIKKGKKDLILCVKDNGIGIASDRIGSVFEKYTRLNTVAGSPAGFGIGLNYVKTVIEKHAGHIEVISEIAKGSEFRIYLPA